VPERASFLRRAARRALSPAGKLAAALASRLDPTHQWSYAQEGEDRVLLRLLEGRAGGFYVDVGAHHPSRFSNTRLFYERGWHGINIEPSPTAIAAFAAARPRDLNLQLGVAEQAGELIYYVFNDPALNTFDAALKREREAQTTYRVVGTRKVAVERLDAVLERHLPPGQAIDFLSVDVEGYDLQVLRSSDWARFRPGVVLVEALDLRLEQAAQHPIHAFMSGVRYELVAKTLNTLFYRDRA
jgi:FkbM family methyltransferase